MNPVARYGKAVAKQGRGEELAGRLLAAAADLENNPACELYLVSRQAGEPEVISGGVKTTSTPRSRRSAGATRSPPCWSSSKTGT